MTLAIALAVVLSGQAADISRVTGHVLGPDRVPLAGAVVAIKGTVRLAVTDADGRFAIDAPADAVLIVDLAGFRAAEARARTGEPLVVTLELAVLADTTTVAATTGDAPPDTRFVLRPIDVVRTAGAQADLMRALAALPGVTTIDEGAGLFVRGGDVSETRVLLDGVAIQHPYRYETPTGGFRGAVDPFLTQGVSFTTGGFSAEYGNSLSAVADMRGLRRPSAPRVAATAGLAGVAGMWARPIGASGGLRLAANRSTPGLLFAVNPSPREFDQLPTGWDLSASGHLTRPRLGDLQLFVLEQHDRVGVRLEQDAFSGFLHSSAAHRLVAVSWLRALPHGWRAEAAAGGDRYVSTLDVGVLALETADTSLGGRLDIAGQARAWHLRLGAEATGLISRVRGQAPERGEDFGGVDGARAFDVAHRDQYTGAYLDARRSFGRLTPGAGVRLERFGHAHATRVDPRLDVAVDFGLPGRVRLAWGRYHQAASPRYFDAERGVDRLRPMTATHLVAGYEAGAIDQIVFVRAEAYLKRYRDLPVDDPARGFADDGFGHARGLDLYARRVWRFIDVRASVSLLDAARRWTPSTQQDRYPLPAGTWRPDFHVPVSARLHVTAPVSRTASVGVSWHGAAGRPFTPVIAAVATARGFDPIFGPINSERMPAYRRLDLSFSVTRPLGRALAIVFVSVDNALGRRNVFEYAYSPDFTERRPIAGPAPRSFYVGCSITR